MLQEHVLLAEGTSVIVEVCAQTPKNKKVIDEMVEGKKGLCA